MGGISDGSKTGYDGGYADGIGIDFVSDRDKLTGLHALKKDSGTTVVDLPKWIREYQGLYYFYGDAGHLYQRNAAGTWADKKTVSSSHGNGMEIFNDFLWYASDAGIGKGTTPSGAITFEDDYFKSLTQEQDQILAASGQAYTTPAAIDENATHRQTFVAAADNITGVIVFITAKGSGNVTLTLHNSTNTVIASKTIATADIENTAPLVFIFDRQYAITATGTYHFHVTSTVADTTLRTGTNADEETADFVTLQYYNPLDVDQSTTLSTEDSLVSYTVPAAISETAYKTFVPDKKGLAAVSLYVYAKGTGDWTVTIHDSNHNVIGTSTVATASMAYRGFQRFAFTTPLTLVDGDTYHIHPTSTVADGSITSSTAATISTIGYMTHFPVLLSDTSFHPMQEYANYCCIGNGRFLAVIEDSEIYNPERLTFPIGEKVRALATIGDNLAILTWRGTSINDYGTSRVYFWDGVSTTFTGFVQLDGQGNAIWNGGDNLLYAVHGTDGSISAYNGYLKKLRKVKGVGENKTIEVYPQAICTWNGILRFGISDGSSTTESRLVYSYGKKDKDFPNALSKDYPISTGRYGSTVKIGAILGTATDKFFVGWYDSTPTAAYGVDIIDTSNDQASAYVEDLRFDGKKPNNEKVGKTVSLRFTKLVTGQTITVAYRLDNDGSFTTLGTISTANLVYESFPFEKRFFEVEFKITLASTTSPVALPSLSVLEMDFEYNTGNQLGAVAVHT